MLIAAVVISSFVLLSSAQRDPDCTAAYDAVFGNETNGTCAQAYYSVYYGNASYDQRAMVCNEDRECNMLLEDIVSTCGDMVSNFII